MKSSTLNTKYFILHTLPPIIPLLSVTLLAAVIPLSAVIPAKAGIHTNNTKKHGFLTKSRMTVVMFLFLVFSFLVVLPTSANAANLYWVGTDGAATNVASNWKTTDPATCGSGDAGAAPGASDVAIFDPDCDNGAAVTTSFSVQGVSMVSGYTGTVTQNAVSMTIGSSGWTQAGGTFTGNSDGSTANITIGSGGDFSLTGGTFTSTNDTLTTDDDVTFGGGTFTHNSGTVKMTDTSDTVYSRLVTITGSATFYNFTLESDDANGGSTTFTIASGTVLTVNNTLTMTNTGNTICGLPGPGSISAKGNIVTTKQGCSGAGVIDINGTGDQTFTGNTNSDTGQVQLLAESAIPSININKASGTLTFSSSVTATKNWTYTQGTVDMTTNSSTVIMSGFDGPAYSQSMAITGSMTFYNLKFYSAGANGNGTTYTIAVGTTLTVANNLDYFDRASNYTCTINGGAITVQGNITSTVAGCTGTVPVTLTGSNSQTLTQSALSFPTGTFTINKSSGTATLGANLNLSGSGQDLLISHGTLDLSTYTLTVNDNITVSGGGILKTTTTGDLVVGSGGVNNAGQVNLGLLSTCGAADGITITSTSGGTARTWTGNGSYDWYDVAVTDLTDQKGAIAAWSSTNNGNNTNIHILSGCPTPPVSNWHFDEGQGTTTSDSAPTAAAGTLAGATLPTWQTEDQCVLGKCLYFDGTSSKVTVASSVPTVSSIGFWVRPTAVATLGLIDLDGGTTKIVTDSSGVISATGFTSPTIYINGRVATTLVANRWQYVEVTTGTAITASAIKIGTDGTNFTKGFFDEVSLFTYARSAAQVKVDYNLGAANLLGANTQNMPGALSNGLVGYWKMDESSWTNNCSTDTVLDSSGNSNNGDACPNSTGPTGGAAGKFGNAGSFDGTNDYITIPNSTSLNQSGDYTVSMWFKTSDYNVDRPHLFSKGETYGGDANVPMWAMLNFNNLTFGYNAGFSAYSISASTSGYSANTWLHFTGVYKSSSKELSMYINGALVAGPTVQAVGTTINTQPLSIGADNGTLLFFSGSIDDTRYYNRTLSPAEVSQLYNWAPGPVGYWKMDEKTGTTANDLSGNANTGTLTNGPTWGNGKYGAAVNLDGADDYVNAGSAATLDNIPVKTVEAWIYPRTLGESSNGKVFSKVGSGWWQVQMTTGNALNFHHSFSTTNGSWTTASSTITLNAWNHIAITYDRTSLSNVPTIYINGVSRSYTVDATPIGTVGDDSTGNLLLGSKADTTESFDGFIDDVRVYNYPRVASQVVEDLNAGHPAPGSPVGTPLGYWKLDQGVDNTCSGGVNDVCNSGSGGNTYDAAQTNMAVPATATSGWNQAGKFKKALTFDGTNDQLDFGDMTPLETATQASWSFWVRPTTLATSQALFVKANNGATQQSWSIMTDASTSTAIRVRIANGATTDQSNYAVTPSGVLANSTWAHVLVAYDGTQTGNANVLKLYVNGIPQTLTFTGTIPTSLLATTSNMRAGAWSDALGTFFNGTLDEMKVFTQPLTASQVLLDMNQSQAQVQGALSTSSTAGNDNASTRTANSAASEYCIPGDSSTCTAPVGRWDLEEGTGVVANDSSGNSNTGDIQAYNGYYTTGKVGKAYSFDGNNTHIFAGSGSTLDNLGASGGMTAEAWVFPKSRGIDSNNAFILTKNAGNSQANGGWLLLINGISGNQVGLEFVVDGSSDLVRDTAATTLTLNQWNHVVVSWDGVMTAATGARIFVNGREATYTGTTNGSTRPTDAASSLYIGNASSQDRTFDGYIDQVTVFNYNRTPAQIAWDYNRGAPLAHWKMDECQGTTINDSSGNGYTGTLTVGGTGTYTAAGTCTSGTSTHSWYGGATGKRNYSIALDGTNDYITVSGIFGSPQAVTLAAWVNLTTRDTNGAEVISIGDSVVIRADYNASPKTSGLFYNGTVYTATPSTNGTDIAGTGWHHLLYTVDQTGGGLQRMYLDGNLIGATAIAGSINYTSAVNTYIGRHGLGALTTYDFNGKIDDVRVYNYALSATQAKTVYNEGATRYGPVTGAP